MLEYENFSSVRRYGSSILSADDWHCSLFKLHYFYQTNKLLSTTFKYLSDNLYHQEENDYHTFNQYDQLAFGF